LPVFDRNEGAVLRASAELAAARHVVEGLRAQIPHEVRAAVHAYRLARGQVGRYAEAYLGQARNARTAVEASYREGASSLLDLLEAERTFIQTQRDHLDALREVRTAAADITAAAALEERQP
jgi:cobalt-zinc-cadmium efflux system outer membrane protein